MLEWGVFFLLVAVGLAHLLKELMGWRRSENQPEANPKERDGHE